MKILKSQKAKNPLQTISLHILGDFCLTVDFSAETKITTAQIYDTK